MHASPQNGHSRRKRHATRLIARALSATTDSSLNSIADGNKFASGLFPNVAKSLVRQATMQADRSVSGVRCLRVEPAFFPLKAGGTYSASFMPLRERTFVFGGAPGCSTSSSPN
jgi:hypothetical protein